MTRQTEQHAPPVLDDDTLQTLGAAMAPTALPPERQQALRAKVMQRIAQEKTSGMTSLITIREGEGSWIQVAPKIEKKLLHVDRDAGTESYLLRVQPGAEAPGHRHEHDELCLVLEGEVNFDDVYLQAGDWHVAPKGSWHGTARSATGALLFLQSGLAAHA